MFTIKIIDRKNEERAVKCFSLLKQDAMIYKNDYYDSDDESISYFTVGNK